MPTPTYFNQQGRCHGHTPQITSLKSCPSEQDKLHRPLLPTGIHPFPTIIVAEGSEDADGGCNYEEEEPVELSQNKSDITYPGWKANSILPSHLPARSCYFTHQQQRFSLRGAESGVAIVINSFKCVFTPIFHLSGAIFLQEQHSRRATQQMQYFYTFPYLYPGKSLTSAASV